METIVTFEKDQKYSRPFLLEGFGSCTLSLEELPFAIAKNSFTANTNFEKGQRVPVQFIKVSEGKDFFANDIKTTAVSETVETTVEYQFFGTVVLCSTTIEIDIEEIRKKLYAHRKMSALQADAFDAFEEGGKIERSQDYKDVSDVSREIDGR